MQCARQGDQRSESCESTLLRGTSFDAMSSYGARAVHSHRGCLMDTHVASLLRKLRLRLHVAVQASSPAVRIELAPATAWHSSCIPSASSRVRHRRSRCVAGAHARCPDAQQQTMCIHSSTRPRHATDAIAGQLSAQTFGHVAAGAWAASGTGAGAA